MSLVVELVDHRHLLRMVRVIGMEERLVEQSVDVLVGRRVVGEGAFPPDLHEAGQAVVPYLQGLDRSKLDPEQVARIRAVLDGLGVEYEDRVDRVSAWLARDPRAWLALATRDDPKQRRIAAERLSGLLGGSVDFDPDAAADVRAKQVERLRARLESAREVPEAE